MDFLSQFLPIIIYVLVIILLVIAIVLGIKLIVTLDKIQDVIDSAKEKINSLNGFFSIVESASGKINYVYERVADVIGGLVDKIFFRKRERNDD